MNRFAITNYSKNDTNYIACSLLDENRSLIDFSIYPKEEQALLHAIYVAKVEKIVPSIQAAFVKISPTQNCYLPLSDATSVVYTSKRSKSSALCAGDELLVQVVREGVKTKDPVVSTKLSLQGNYSVLTTENTALGISNKLSEEQREKLRGIVSQLIPTQEERSYGLIIRTLAATCEKEELLDDIKDLIRQYEALSNNAIHAALYTRCYEPVPAFLGAVKTQDITAIDQIVTDDKAILLLLEQSFPNLKEKFVLYEDASLSLNRLYKIGTTIEELLGKRIWLKSGANIIIEQLETLTFIDVNTAKNQSKKSSALLSVNMEAAKEAIRQIRLRNISGMILIDFINMDKTEEEALICFLKSEIRKDSIPFHFIDITRLGLVEMTRKKVQKSLAEVIKKPVDLP